MCIIDAVSNPPNPALPFPFDLVNDRSQSFHLPPQLFLSLLASSSCTVDKCNFIFRLSKFWLEVKENVILTFAQAFFLLSFWSKCFDCNAFCFVLGFATFALCFNLSNFLFFSSVNTFVAIVYVVQGSHHQNQLFDNGYMRIHLMHKGPIWRASWSIWILYHALWRPRSSSK